MRPTIRSAAVPAALKRRLYRVVRSVRHPGPALERRRIRDEVARFLGGRDVLAGYDGLDTINGGLGNDVILGGNYMDILSGGQGNGLRSPGSGYRAANSDRSLHTKGRARRECDPTPPPRP